MGARRSLDGVPDALRLLRLEIVGRIRPVKFTRAGGGDWGAAGDDSEDWGAAGGSVTGFEWGQLVAWGRCGGNAAMCGIGSSSGSAAAPTVVVVVEVVDELA